MSVNLTQIIPSEICFSCDICCRFPEETSPYAPFFTSDEIQQATGEGLSLHFFQGTRGSYISLVPQEEGCLCPAFDPKTARCTIYEVRPFDCRLYPFLLMRAPKNGSVLLGVDTRCPFIQESRERGPLSEYIRALISFLGGEDVIQMISSHPGLIMEYQKDSVILATLEGLTAACPPSILHPLRLEDRALFEKYLTGTRLLSHYSFVPHFIWNGLLDYYWAIIGESFCLFAASPDGFFMPLPPQGGDFSVAVKECFALMRLLNRVEGVARIENLRREEADRVRSGGYRVLPFSSEYLYCRDDLVGLHGDRYKEKRWAVNHFCKHYLFTYDPFETGDIAECLTLYKEWREMRRARSQDSYYQALLDDAFSAHQQGMMMYRELGLRGGVVRVDGVIKGYILGYPLSAQVFCVLFEICDLRIKGLSNFIFREFCRGLEGYTYINCMDDSGLPGLRQVKLSYHPSMILPSFLATGC